MKYTPAQSQAINQRGESILLSAGAGSGKTKVLVERIIKMIVEEKVSADQLLVVTFTKAAAGEMKNRISEALYQKLAEDPHSVYLNEQCLLLNNAAITTIHSFCLDLVREYYYLLGIDANMKVGNETECHLLKEQALDDYLEFKYRENSPIFREILERYGGQEDEKIREIIFMLYEQAIALPDYEQWLQNLGQTLTDPAPWLEYMQKQAIDETAETLKILQSAIDLCREDAKCAKKYLDSFLLDRDLLETAAAKLAVSLDDFIEFVDRQEFFAASVRANQKESEFYNEAVALYKEARDKFKLLNESLANAHSAQAQNDLAELYPLVREFGRLTCGFGEYYAYEKCRRNILDFDDMGHLALQLLYEPDGQPTALSLELKKRFSAVLIDEYQDTNDLQEQIMLAVSREDNYFMVGDVKQSIYSFRMANPSLFKGKYDTFRPEQKIDMNKNFRSRANIVAATNDLFNLLMPGGDENPAYRATAQMEFGAAYYAAEGADIADQSIKVWSVVKSQSPAAENTEGEEEPAENPAAIAQEALLIAREIKRLLKIKQPIFAKETNEYRPISYRDIVIIMRAPSNGAEEIQRVLAENDIPCYLEKKSGYFASWEVQITLDLLSVLDNPQQDLPLAAVLKAPFIGFTNYSDAELLLLRQLLPQKNLYECLEKAADDAECALQEKAQTTLEVLAKMRDWAVRCPLSELLTRLYRECRLLEYAAVLPNGPERANNLEALYDKALQYEQSNAHGLFMFLDFIRQMQKKNQTIEPAPLIGENVDVVRIMSIHQSKGLEFPVVFLPGMSKRFFIKDYTADVLLDKNLGLILPNVDLKSRVIYPTVCTQVMQNKKKEALLAEEKRILYVAMTRAREHLYFIGQEIESTPGKERCYMDWLNALKAYLASCSADWEFASFDLSAEAAEEPAALAKEDRPLSPEQKDELKTALAWQYPHAAQCYIPTKTSITAINEKKQLDTHFIDRSAFNRPLFMQSQAPLTAAEKGTILHRIMNQVDLKAEITMDYVNSLALNMIEKNIIPPEALKEVSLAGITDFFNSDLGLRLRQSKIVCRERPFTLPAQIFDSSGKPCTILLQGIIDCMWLEEDGWVLIDYKSNHVPRGKEDEFVAAYYSQIALYARAIKEIWREPLKEAYLYLLNGRRAIEVNLDQKSE